MEPGPDTSRLLLPQKFVASTSRNTGSIFDAAVRHRFCHHEENSKEEGDAYQVAAADVTRLTPLRR